MIRPFLACQGAFQCLLFDTVDGFLLPRSEHCTPFSKSIEDLGQHIEPETRRNMVDPRSVRRIAMHLLKMAREDNHERDVPDTILERCLDDDHARRGATIQVS